MNDFERSLTQLLEEGNAIKKREALLEQESRLFNEKLMGFLKENGAPATGTIPELLLLAIRKSRELIKL